MFGRISGRYDLLNTVMSGGRHHAWRRIASRLVTNGLQGHALDVATGTGDFAVALATQPSISDVVGLDAADAMLVRARHKAERARLLESVSFLLGDAHQLPFPTGHFVAATVGFGIRNFADVRRAIGEMARVIRPGGRLATLEIVRITGRSPLKVVFPVYFRHVTPWLGAALAGDREAYTYLPESVERFLSAEEVGEIMEQAGLRIVEIRRYALGSVAILVGEKPLG